MDCESRIGVGIGLTVLCGIFVVIFFIIYFKRNSLTRKDGLSSKDKKLKGLLQMNSNALHITPKPKTHDILVHCCTEDIAWVKDVALCHLETKLKRRCYLSYRDSSNLGKDVVDAIDDDTSATANMLIVISKEYVAYSWHAYYVKMAHQKSIFDDIPLVFLFLDDLKIMHFPEFCQIQQYLLYHRLVEWDDGTHEKAKEKFWRELAEEYLTNIPECSEEKTMERIKGENKPCNDPYRMSTMNVEEKRHFFYQDNTREERRINREKEWIRPAVTSAMLEDQIISDPTEAMKNSESAKTVFTPLSTLQAHTQKSKQAWFKRQKKFKGSHDTIQEVGETCERQEYDSGKDSKLTVDDVDFLCQAMNDLSVEINCGDDQGDDCAAVLEEVITKTDVYRQKRMNWIDVLALLKESDTRKADAAVNEVEDLAEIVVGPNDEKCSNSIYILMEKTHAKG